MRTQRVMKISTTQHTEIKKEAKTHGLSLHNYTMSIVSQFLERDHKEAHYLYPPGENDGVTFSFDKAQINDVVSISEKKGVPVNILLYNALITRAENITA